MCWDILLIFKELFSVRTLRIIEAAKAIVISLDTHLSKVIWLMPSLKALIKLYSERHVFLKQNVLH